ncbi:uncharacterized protein ColSpa_09774 [Colletotrichum spaethianum]|uniref:Uncharacterized protein n=1 Tax=Colletotrichum spaethianum TaxID=700344 RepID=A0AA37USA2_9PEZI|nr:uncharacterized protein ColSpa_09774 [Colletotrichum spaethianum]GKT49593.1 hypothetical protein ColSpa_09774 [Colletotrichum spaethianum]
MPLPPAPCVKRSGRSAARPGLKEAQRASYLMQFHVIELETFLKDQTNISKTTHKSLSFHESMIVRLQGLVEKPDITKDDIAELIEAHRAEVSKGKKDLDAASSNENRAMAQISMHTTNHPNVCTQISAGAAFRSVVDDLDVVVHALEESLPPNSVHARDNIRLRLVLASKEAEITRLGREIKDLKGKKEETEGRLINLLD